jgi:hypothetical protein
MILAGFLIISRARIRQSHPGKRRAERALHGINIRRFGDHLSDRRSVPGFLRPSLPIPVTPLGVALCNHRRRRWRHGQHRGAFVADDHRMDSVGAMFARRDEVHHFFTIFIIILSSPAGLFGRKNG